MRNRRKLSGGEIFYGVIVIALIIYMIYDSAVNGRGGNDVYDW